MSDRNNNYDHVHLVTEDGTIYHGRLQHISKKTLIGRTMVFSIPLAKGASHPRLDFKEVQVNDSAGMLASFPIHNIREAVFWNYDNPIGHPHRDVLVTLNDEHLDSLLRLLGEGEGEMPAHEDIFATVGGTKNYLLKGISLLPQPQGEFGANEHSYLAVATGEDVFPTTLQVVSETLEAYHAPIDTVYDERQVVFRSSGRSRATYAISPEKWAVVDEAFHAGRKFYVIHKDTMKGDEVELYNYTSGVVCEVELPYKEVEQDTPQEDDVPNMEDLHYAIETSPRVADICMISDAGSVWPGATKLTLLHEEGNPPIVHLEFQLERHVQPGIGVVYKGERIGADVFHLEPQDLKDYAPDEPYPGSIPNGPVTITMTFYTAKAVRICEWMLRGAEANKAS